MKIRILGEPQPLGRGNEPVHLAIGVFDGVHLGHAAVVRKTLDDARSSGGTAAVVTFDRHPSRVVAPDHAPAMIYPLWRRLAALESAGMPAALVCEFTEEFSRQTGEEFVRRLVNGFGRVAGITVGAGFVFGHRRSGDVALLQRLGSETGFAVDALPPLVADGDVVSSTRIRERIAAGDLEGAGRLLGRTYGIAGDVVEGDRIGRTLGFPTANLDVTDLVLPPLGVYGARVCVGGAWRSAAVNIGRRPTVNGHFSGTRVEAHLLDFAGDLYGHRLEVQLGPRLRGEVRFPSREALREQIGRDVAAVRDWAAGQGNKGLP